MSAEGAYSPKRADIVLFRIDNFQQLNVPTTLVTTQLTPVVPNSALMPWWMTHPNVTEFILQPGTYGIGLNIQTAVPAIATNGAISSGRIIYKINGVNNSQQRLSLDMVPPAGGYLNSQHTAFAESKVEFSTITTFELETQATLSGDAVIETRTGSNVYFVRYS